MVEHLRVVDGMCGARLGSGREAREGTSDREGEESCDHPMQKFVVEGHEKADAGADVDGGHMAAAKAVTIKNIENINTPMRVSSLRRIFMCKS